MNMIKKIAMTASILLFALAQVFSFYVIRVSHREKIELLTEWEGKAFADALSHFASDIAKYENQMSINDNMAVYFFRQNMPEGAAIYKAGEELFNSSRYAFDGRSLDFDAPAYPCNSRQETIGGRHLIVFYNSHHAANAWENDREYRCFYAVDITHVYEESYRLIWQESLVALAASLAIALLLVVLIKKITRPLQAVNETQRQLIGSMSHELKTPLTAIKGYAETLLEVSLREEQKEKALRYIYQESGRLSRLSDKMTELTRLYEPECKVAFVQTGMEDLFEAVEKSVAYSLTEKQIILLREGDYMGQSKYLDADLMTSFLINLVNNACMASAFGSRIFLGADKDSVWVRDEGCGIEPQELDKVKKAFYRIDKSRSRKSGNMGLGLALCEQIAAVHHGAMEIESRLGEGTKVTMRFPLQNDYNKKNI